MIGNKFLVAAAGVLALCVAPAQAQVLGSDAAACAGDGPAVRATIIGLKDRAGFMKLELYPANETDFLQKDRILAEQGKFFRRVQIDTPKSGAVTLCIKAPRAGRYALLVTHERDGSKKFSVWKDGAGFPSNRSLGRSQPKLREALIDVSGVTDTTIKMQYLRGLGGFAPAK